MPLDEIVIVGATRTAVGNFNGSLSSIPAHILGSYIIKALLEKTGLNISEIDEVILGQVLTAACGQNPARQAALAAGLEHKTPAWTINQVCGSGLKAISMAAMSIITGNSSIVIAGGQENMSQAPHVINIRKGVKMGDSPMIDSMIKDGLWDCFNNYHMGITAENLANKYSISRFEQDNYSYNSQQKALKAKKLGLFDKEITPVLIKDRKGDMIFKDDEFIRQETTIDGLSLLRPAFTKDGTVTAGNSSGINDGAAIVALTRRSIAEKKGLKILATIKSFAQSGVDPAIMGIGPVTASEKALKIASWEVKDLDIIEANEAFAAQAIAVSRELKLPLDKVNINGGAIAIGHPIGASGARILVTLLHAMQENNLKRGLATLCIGGGMGIAMCLER